MSAEYRVGEVVDIEIKGARIMAPKPGIDDVLTLGIAESRPGVWHTIEIPKDASNAVTITRVWPADGPPRPGDLWRDRSGRSWFGISYDDDDEPEPRVILVDPVADRACLLGGDYYRPEHVSERYGPLTLVHREPEAGESGE